MNLLMKYVLLHVTLKKKTTVQFVETVEMEEREFGLVTVRWHGARRSGYEKS